jgi:hypothetical protein
MLNPMVHQALVLANVRRNVVHVCGPWNRVFEVLEQATQAGVGRIPNAVDDAGCGKQPSSESQVQKVVGHFVCDSFGMGCQGPNPIQIQLSVSIQSVGVQFCSGHQLCNHLKFTAFASTVDFWVTIEHLFQQSGPGTRNANNEDRSGVHDGALGKRVALCFDDAVDLCSMRNGIKLQAALAVGRVDRIVGPI